MTKDSIGFTSRALLSLITASVLTIIYIIYRLAAPGQPGISQTFIQAVILFIPFFALSHFSINFVISKRFYLVPLLWGSVAIFARLLLYFAMTSESSRSPIVLPLLIGFGAYFIFGGIAVMIIHAAIPLLSKRFSWFIR